MGIRKKIFNHLIRPGRPYCVEQMEFHRAYAKVYEEWIKEIDEERALKKGKNSHF